MRGRNFSLLTTKLSSNKPGLEFKGHKDIKIYIHLSKSARVSQLSWENFARHRVLLTSTSPWNMSLSACFLARLEAVDAA